MSAMSDLEKLKILIPHWMEHNREHGNEFLQWVERAEKLGSHTLSSRLKEACEQMQCVNDRLRACLEILDDSGASHE